MQHFCMAVRPSRARSCKGVLTDKKSRRLTLICFARGQEGRGTAPAVANPDGSVYSRRITKEHRLVYKIYDEVVEVPVLSTFGHYR